MRVKCKFEMQVVEIVQASTEHVHPNPATQIHAQQQKVVFRLRKNNLPETTQKQTRVSPRQNIHFKKMQVSSRLRGTTCFFLKLVFRLRETPTLGGNGEPS